MAPLAPIKPGDIVLVNRRGRRFHAVVEEKAPRILSRIRPLQSGVTYTTAKAHEVEEHWRKTKNVRKVKESVSSEE